LPRGIVYPPPALTRMRSSLPRRSLVLAAAPGVEGRVAAWPVVQRGVAVGEERVGVVAGGQEQVAAAVEVDLATDVAADAAVGGHVDDLLLGAEVQPVADQLEAGQTEHAAEARPVGLGALEGRVALVDLGRGRVVDRRVQRRRVVQVDPVVAGEVGVDRDALEALLVVLVDGDLRGQGIQAGPGVVDPHLTGARGVQHVQVGKNGEAHRLARAVVEGDLLEAGGWRGRLVVRSRGWGGGGGCRQSRQTSREDHGDEGGC
jgi:hypothetical protein